MKENLPVMCGALLCQQTPCRTCATNPPISRQATTLMTIVASGSDKYLVSEKKVGEIDHGADIIIATETLDFSESKKEVQPITVVNYPPSTPYISLKWLQSIFEYMLSTDDVLSPLFLESLVFAVSPGSKLQQPPAISRRTVEFLKGSGVKKYSFNFIKSHDEIQIQNGPYFRVGQRVHEVLKLYPDPYGAFVYGVVLDNNRFKQPSTNLIPVPSRLYSPSSPSLPLSGKRIAIKDIIDLKGLPTAASSKAFAEYHGPVNETAAAVQRLIDLGAVVIGKTKTTQFATGETARDWIEFQCPFNPRGCGFFDPAGSSTGSAVAVAGYEWVDYAIGTDTCGSIIWPAALQGIFGLRPTLGVSRLEGVMPVSSKLDTLGFFARDITNLKLFQQVCFESKSGRVARKPSRIIVPEGALDPFNESKKAIISNFIVEMMKFGSISSGSLDIESLWERSEFSRFNKSYKDYLHSTVAHIQICDSHAHEDEFYQGFKHKLGIYPYINPMVLHKWNIRSGITPSQYEEAAKRKSQFKNFLDSYIFQDGSIMVLPAGRADITYRDELIPPESMDNCLQSFGFDDTFYSILGGLPTVVIPVGQCSVVSKVTKNEVWEPVSVMVVGAEGTESQIIKLVEKILKASRRPMGVNIGDRAFELIDPSG
ncbi:hypothetical protein TWF694_007075 [Orbilia ellipsospora]|uniref:Amidase domain-containing protein n=1 Tax=Orbilia ellipsospora TaxID=2528407 RepID=A0AAV9XM19_9PEZI